MSGFFTLSHRTAPPSGGEKVHCDRKRTITFFYKVAEQVIFFVKYHKCARTFPKTASSRTPPHGDGRFDC